MKNTPPGEILVFVWPQRLSAARQQQRGRLVLLQQVLVDETAHEGGVLVEVHHAMMPVIREVPYLEGHDLFQTEFQAG